MLGVMKYAGEGHCWQGHFGKQQVLEDIHALLLFGVAIEQNRWIVLADVVVGTGTRVEILEP